LAEWNTCCGECAPDKPCTTTGNTGLELTQHVDTLCTVGLIPPPSPPRHLLRLITHPLLLRHYPLLRRATVLLVAVIAMSSAAPSSSSEGESSAAGSGAVHSVHSAIHSNQYAQQAGQFLSPNYQSPFFDCLTDPTGCLLVCLCPCVVIAALKSNLDSRPQSLVDLCCCANPYQMRQTIRAKYSIPVRHSHRRTWKEEDKVQVEQRKHRTSC
jgi:hypothetical protein